jgi:hypothetical protein
VFAAAEAAAVAGEPVAPVGAGDVDPGEHWGEDNFGFGCVGEELWSWVSCGK